MLGPDMILHNLLMARSKLLVTWRTVAGERYYNVWITYGGIVYRILSMTTLETRPSFYGILHWH
jgi:hypothetical protein